MLPVSEKVERGEESQTLAFAAKARQMKESGIDVVSLTAGEPDFPTPRHVKDAAIRAIEENFTHYTANQGIPELLLAISRKFERDNDLRFGPQEILVSTGAKQSIFNALQAICNPGDEVIVLSPYWVSYPEMVRLVDAIPVIVPTTFAGGFKPQASDVQKALSRKTKAIILNSPCNPTGAVYSRDHIAPLVPLIKESGIYVLSDEIYENIRFEGRIHTSIGSFDDIRSQVITINGVSKAYAMTGWRIGYMGGPRHVIQAAAKVQSQVTSNAASISQKAALAALEGDTSDVEAMAMEFKRRRDFVHESLSNVPALQVFLPEGAFYFFLGVGSFYGGSLADSEMLTNYLLEQWHVALVPGGAFGADDCIRLSYACSMPELAKGMDRIKKGLEEIASRVTRSSS